MPMTGNARETTLGQLRELHIRVLAALPLDMPWETAQGWIQNPQGLGKVLRTALMPPKAKEIDLIASWIKFYKKFFNCSTGFLSSGTMPSHQPGFDRLIVVARGLTLEQVFETCQKNFPCWKYVDDLDKAVTRNDRNPDQAYAIWVRDRQEADEELKNLSADQLKAQGIAGITLLERLLYELKHWDETREHLDIQNITLCSGSRDAVGVVPDAHWYGGEFKVSWCRLGSAYDFLRSRSAVSS